MPVTADAFAGTELVHVLQEVLGGGRCIRTEEVPVQTDA